jgi:hypothetical protein
MKPLRRILLNALTALSLVVCAATVTLWVWSYRRLEGVQWRGVEQIAPARWQLFERRIILFRGQVGYWSRDVAVIRDPNDPMVHWRGERSHWHQSARTVGLDFWWNTQPSLGFRVWLIAGLCGLPGIAWWSRRRRNAPRWVDMCPQCGYDLRATPDRCPECGMTANQ